MRPKVSRAAESWRRPWRSSSGSACRPSRCEMLPTWQRAVDLLSSVLDQAGKLGLTICLEPLSTVETNFINTVAEGMKDAAEKVVALAR